MHLLQLLCKRHKDQDDSEKDSERQKEDLAPVIMSAPGKVSFERILDGVIRRRKVNRAAILDHHGNALAIVADWRVLPDEGLALLRVLRPARRSEMWRFQVFGEDFLCFPCEDRETIMGRSPLTVIVAHLTRKCIVVGLAPADVPGSCLHEMKAVWAELEKSGE